MPSPQDVLERLKGIPYPGYSRDIVSFGVIEDVEIGGRGTTIRLTPASRDPQVLDEIRGRIRETVESMGIGPVEFAVEAPPPQSLGAARAKQKLQGIRSVIAVASGKGGVGKSTVAVNLSLALSRLGRRVGLLDADVYGPSVPVMLGIQERPTADEQRRIVPIERYGLKTISMGMFLDSGKATIWRGPMVTKLLVEFVQNVLWGDLDILVLDLPPGTGDAQLTICQQVPLSGGLIVTTPSDVALLDVRRGVTMFHDVNVPVLGVIENMAYHVCRGCGHRADLFGRGGAESVSEKLGIPLLGSLPLVSTIRESGDSGRPIVIESPECPESKSFADLARRVEEHLAAESGKASAPFLQT